jgi:hypothetical protein
MCRLLYVCCAHVITSLQAPEANIKAALVDKEAIDSGNVRLFEVGPSADPAVMLATMLPYAQAVCWGLALIHSCLILTPMSSAGQ